MANVYDPTEGQGSGSVGGQEYKDDIGNAIDKNTERLQPSGWDSFLNVVEGVTDLTGKWGNSVGNFFSELFGSSNKVEYDANLKSNVYTYKDAIMPDGSTKDMHTVRVYKDCSDFFYNRPIDGYAGREAQTNMGEMFTAISEDKLSPEQSAEWESYKESMSTLASVEYDENGQLIPSENIKVDWLGNCEVVLNDKYVPVSDLDIKNQNDLEYGVDSQEKDGPFNARVDELMDKYGLSEDLAKRQTIMESTGAYTPDEIANDIQSKQGDAATIDKIMGETSSKFDIEGQTPEEVVRNMMDSTMDEMNGDKIKDTVSAEIDRIPLADTDSSGISKVGADVISAVENRTASAPVPADAADLEKHGVTSGGTEAPNMESNDTDKFSKIDVPARDPSMDASKVEQRWDDDMDIVEAEKDKMSAAIDDYLSGKSDLKESLGADYNTEQVFRAAMTKASEDKDLDSVTIRAYSDMLSDIADNSQSGVADVVDYIEDLPGDVKESVSPIIEGYKMDVENQTIENRPEVDFELDGKDFVAQPEIDADKVDFSQLLGDVEAQTGIAVDDSFINDTSLDMSAAVDAGADIPDIDTPDSSANLSFDDMLSNVDAGITDSGDSFSVVDVSAFFE